MRVFSAIYLTAALTGLVVSSAAAQESTAPPAHISFVEGGATIERAGEIESAALNMLVIEGDRLKTTTGRLQITFPNGSAIDIEPDSEVEYLGAGRVRVYAGTVENRPALAVRTGSAEYLPAETQSYATDLDQNGTWQYDTSYGNVWYPTVAASWRPYYYGYWSSVPAYGWTWVGYNRWAWPTHHYGRWGYARNRWFWIPGRSYASAWVSWGTAPGYVSWCPLGYDSRPVVALSVGYQRGWNAWTIVPRDHFGWRGYPAHRYAVEPYRVAASTPFIVQRSAPAATFRGYGSSVSAQRSHGYAAGGGFANDAPRAGTAVPRFSTPGERDGRSSSLRSSPQPGVDSRRGAAPPSFDRRGSVAAPVLERPGASSPAFDRRSGVSSPSFDRRPPQPAAPGFQPASPSFRQPQAVQRSAPAYQRPAPPAPSYQPPAPSTQRPDSSYQRPAPSYQPPRPQSQPPAAAPRSGGGHMGNAPRGDRGSSGGARQNDGSSQSRGGAPQGTAVRRSR